MNKARMRGLCSTSQETVGWMMGDHRPLTTPCIYAGFGRLPHGAVSQTV